MPDQEAVIPTPNSGDDLKIAEEERDLGFGSVVSNESHERLLNRDGTFNVERHGLRLRDSLSPYQALLDMSWSRFLLVATGGYLITCALFALLYYLCGPDALIAPPVEGAVARLQQAFFFSVHTLSTVGYGHLAPASTAANSLMVAQSVIGLFGVALVTGLVFARFSRPSARILFSRRAVVAPFRGGRAFMFRVANQRKSQLVDLRAQVLFSHLEDKNGEVNRNFHQLDLQRSKVMFFPLSWTIVHAIDDESPLAKFGKTECLAADAEFLVLLSGIDETFSQTVHAWSSYKADEVVWDAVFDNIFERQPGEGTVAINVGKLHDVHPADE